jgi:hypothetical protein
MLTANVPAGAVHEGDRVGGRRVHSVILGRTEVALTFNAAATDFLRLRQGDIVRVDYDPTTRRRPCPSP